MISPNEPQSLGDLFDSSFSLMGRTFFRNVAVVAVILIPASFLFAFGMEWFYSSLAEAIAAEQEAEGEQVVEAGAAMAAMAGFFVSTMVFGAAFVAGSVVTSMIACREYQDRPVRWDQALVDGFRGPVWKGILMAIVLIAGIAGLATTLGVILAILISAGGWGVGVLVGMVMILLALPIYLWIRWSFTIESIAWEDADVFQSFRRSGELVHGTWWRTFGIILLFSFLTNFAIGLLTTPLGLLFFWDLYREQFQMMGGENGIAEEAELTTTMLSSMGWGMGLMGALSIALTYFIEPAYKAVMFFDLRARHNASSQGISPGAGGADISPRSRP